MIYMLFITEREEISYLMLNCNMFIFCYHMYNLSLSHNNDKLLLWNNQRKKYMISCCLQYAFILPFIFWIYLWFIFWEGDIFIWYLQFMIIYLFESKWFVIIKNGKMLAQDFLGILLKFDEFLIRQT